MNLRCVLPLMLVVSLTHEALAADGIRPSDAALKQEQTLERFAFTRSATAVMLGEVLTVADYAELDRKSGKTYRSMQVQADRVYRSPYESLAYVIDAPIDLKLSAPTLGEINAGTRALFFLSDLEDSTRPRSRRLVYAIAEDYLAQHLQEATQLFQRLFYDTVDRQLPVYLERPSSQPADAKPRYFTATVEVNLARTGVGSSYKMVTPSGNGEFDEALSRVLPETLLDFGYPLDDLRFSLTFERREAPRTEQLKQHEKAELEAETSKIRAL